MWIGGWRVGRVDGIRVVGDNHEENEQISGERIQEVGAPSNGRREPSSGGRIAGRMWDLLDCIEQDRDGKEFLEYWSIGFYQPSQPKNEVVLGLAVKFVCDEEQGGEQEAEADGEEGGEQDAVANGEEGGEQGLEVDDEEGGGQGFDVDEEESGERRAVGVVDGEEVGEQRAGVDEKETGERGPGEPRRPDLQFKAGGFLGWDGQGGALDLPEATEGADIFLRSTAIRPTDRVFVEVEDVIVQSRGPDMSENNFQRFNLQKAAEWVTVFEGIPKNRLECV